MSDSEEESDKVQESPPTTRSSSEVRETLFRIIMDHATDGILFIDAENRIRDWNSVAERLFDLTSAEFPTHPNVLKCLTLTPEEVSQFLAKGVLEAAGVVENQTHSSPIHVERLFNTIEVSGEHWVYVRLKNRTLQQRIRKELYEQARTDELSGLLNRRGFQATLENHLDRQLALAIIDVDFFKSINDQFGHETGDRAIQWIANKISTSFADAICIGRLGGDEFGVVLEIGPGEISSRFDEFCGDVGSDPIPWFPPGMTISIGVAISKVPGLSARMLLASADKSMYQSKQEGRNRSTANRLQ